MAPTGFFDRFISFYTKYHGKQLASIPGGLKRNEIADGGMFRASDDPPPVLSTTAAALLSVGNL